MVVLLGIGIAVIYAEYTKAFEVSERTWREWSGEEDDEEANGGRSVPF